ncbi:hypothetical protein BKA70DRAFT_1324973 [Coprinopsis sp. MPI-PUGE-AT-0042]|nr:hypothetical protein BKA70DRAFT_1324973 [Coprinopsis sp. MPI-PUGE-AT-0042]
MPLCRCRKEKKAKRFAVTDQALDQKSFNMQTRSGKVLPKTSEAVKKPPSAVTRTTRTLGPNGTMVDVTQTATNKHWRWVWNEEPSPPEHTPSSSTPSTPGAGAVDPRFVTPSPHGFPITSPPPLERPRAQHHPLERHNAWIGDTPSIFALGNGRVLAPAANVADEADDGLSSPKADAYQMHRAGLRHSGSPGARGPRMVGPEGTIIMREHASVKPAVPVLASPFQMDISPRRSPRKRGNATHGLEK